jgi:Fic family protein
MQVVSGPTGRERVHFEAPAASRLDYEMKAFLEWFNRAVTIHPFGDANGRIARAIADQQLTRSEQSAQRFYSMSAQIRQERNAYYDLEPTQKGDLEITSWLAWFLGCLDRAFEGAETILSSALLKARLWDLHFGKTSTSDSARSSTASSTDSKVR